MEKSQAEMLWDAASQSPLFCHLVRFHLGNVTAGSAREVAMFRASILRNAADALDPPVAPSAPQD